MNKDRFEIRFRKDFDRKIYRATVVITSRSENIIRMTVKAGAKEMQMEKWLFRKTNQWKIRRMSFEMTGNTKSNAKLVMNIQNEIDFQLKKNFP
ncbi:MAG: hypothetical protein ACRDEB_01930 [Chitinophagaceae bacterium]